MSFFDKLKQAVTEVADTGARQVEILKLQSQLGTVETEIERQYAEAGKRVRELYRRKEILDSEIEVIMKRIDALQAEVDELRLKVQEQQQAGASGEYGRAGREPVDAAGPGLPTAGGAPRGSGPDCRLPAAGCADARTGS